MKNSLYLGKNILVDKDGNIFNFMKTEKYIVIINSNLTITQRNILYKFNNPPINRYSNFEKALKDAIKYVVDNNSSITLNVHKKYNIIDNVYIHLDENPEVLELKLYRQNNIIYLSNIFKYDIEAKELTLKYPDLTWESIIKSIIPKNLKLKKYSIKGVSFADTKYINSDNKLYFKNTLLETNIKMGLYINYTNLEYFKIRFEDIKKRRKKKIKKSSGYYTSQEKTISLDNNFNYFNEKAYYHEFGHHLDYSLQRKYSYSFMKCIYKQINNKLKDMFTLQYIKNTETLYEETKSYLLEPKEIFARIFAEYLEYKTNMDEKILNKYSIDDINMEHKVDCYSFTIEELEEVYPIIDRLILCL